MGIEDLYVTANATRNAPDYDTVVLGALLHTVEAFARVTYQSVYLIDYYKHEFLYISDNPLFLCGHTAKEVKELGYEFYLRHIPEREYKMFVELDAQAYKLFKRVNDSDKYQCSVSCHLHLKSGTKSVLVNHQLTPLLLTDEGTIWIAMCVVSLPSYKTAGHVRFRVNGSDNFWKYSFVRHEWKEYKEISLKEEELDALRLSIEGHTMTEISDMMCRSVDSVKFYKRGAFGKLGVANISEAVARAISNKMF